MSNAANHQNHDRKLYFYGFHVLFFLHRSVQLPAHSHRLFRLFCLNDCERYERLIGYFYAVLKAYQTESTSINISKIACSTFYCSQLKTNTNTECTKCVCTVLIDQTLQLPSHTSSLMK